MVRLSALLLFTLLGSSLPEMFRQYRQLMEADALYEAHAYSRAETAFRRISSTIPEGKERSSTEYNLACALYMQGKYSEAAAHFAARPGAAASERELKQKALFNEGNSLARRATGSGDKQNRIAFFRQSLDRFRSVLLGNPRDGDAKINYEIVLRYLHQLEKPKSPPSSGSGQKNPASPKSGISSNIAEHLLEKAQQDESSLMRQIARPAAAPPNAGGNRDW